MKKKYKLWIAGIWGDPILNAASGLEDMGDAEILRNDFKGKDTLRNIYRFVNLRLGGHGIGIIHFLLETRIFDKLYKLSKCNFHEYEENYVIIFNSAIQQYYSKGYFNRLRKRHHNLKFVLYIIDPMPNGMWPRIENMISVFDKVLTAHLYNSKRYGIEYFPYIYTRPKDVDTSLGMSGDLYFVGVIDEHRYGVLSEVLNECRKNDVKYNIQLFKAERFPKVEDANVKYGLLSYGDNVQKAVQSNCILEIVRKDFIGFTQRYFEAIVLNKKLLTNNPGIKEMPYYNPNYMFYFEKVEDIDWHWVKERSDIDYQYHGDFEPKVWKENIVKIVHV